MTERKLKKLFAAPIFRTIALSLLLPGILLSAGCTTARTPNAKQPDQLVIATDINLPGFSTLNGEPFGYQYDLLTAYADYLGMELRVIPDMSPARAEAQLAANRLDMVSISWNRITDANNVAVPLYSTTYVVLALKREARTQRADADIHALLEGKRVVISQGFSGSPAYDKLLDALRGTDTYLSSRNYFALLEELSLGKVDFLICERSEARLGCALVRNVTEVYEFDEEVPVYVLFNPEHAQLALNFSDWLAAYRCSDEYVELNRLYFDRGMADRIVTRGIRERDKGALSVYDETFKTICRREKIDWRLVAAIAYNESKFNPYLVSPRGARGMMQIMPAVARQFKVPAEEVMDPEQNITLAIKLIKTIEKSLRIAPETDFDNRTSLILACYNGGIGHVLDARKLAAKYGKNPDSWTDVAHFLQQKASEEVASDEVVRSGVFTGSPETLAFVSNVIIRYHAYCNRVAE
ncbi:MAG: transglycosylase SLT domain-containing protein [Rikenellaceae bacterium]|jgi:membrane-bound lytic murein transglycosylase F|nr:transglycosylase SLT domain-containing protein [Rikenellaceae bacterium]